MSIWSPTLKSKINTNQYLTLNEGNTPLEEFEIRNVETHIKREDLNPTGSWKDRASAYKITRLAAEGITECTIASSGNAAISIMQYADQANIKVHVVVSPNANPEKLKLIDELVSQSVHQMYLTTKAKRKAAHLAAQLGIPNLKTSIDPDAPVGYQSLGMELDKHNYTDIFIPASSGTALVGIISGMQSKPRIHVCQTAEVCAIARAIEGRRLGSRSSGIGTRGSEMGAGNSKSGIRNPKFEAKNSVVARQSLADSIVDKSALRSPQIVKLVKETNGFGWAITNDQLIDAEKVLSEQIGKLSYTSLLSVASYLQAQDIGAVGGKPLLIASGA